MKDYYIVKKGTTKNKVLKPLMKIGLEEYQDAVNQNKNLTWSEDTKHGAKFFEENKKEPVFNRSYLNYDPEDVKSFVQLIYSNRGGYINAMFEVRVTKQGLKDLLDFAEFIDCELWELKPRIKVDEEYINNSKYK